MIDNRCRKNPENRGKVFVETPFLKEVCGLLKTYTDYDTYEKIAKKIGVSARTLSGYWDQNTGPSSLPDKNVPKFIKLLQEVINTPLSEQGAKVLLKTNPVALHNRLLPCSGAWGRLLAEHEDADPLDMEIHKMAGYNFGSTDDEPFAPQATALLFQGFSFSTNLPWAGEICMIAEKDGEWRIINLQPGERTLMFKRGHLSIPPLNEDGKKNPLRERELTGYYRYFLIARRSRFDITIRNDLNQANPFSQIALDMLGDHLLTINKSSRLVQCALIKIE